LIDTAAYWVKPGARFFNQDLQDFLGFAGLFYGNCSKKGICSKKKGDYYFYPDVILSFNEKSDVFSPVLISQLGQGVHF
jgi:hypothetical protein